MSGLVVKERIEIKGEPVVVLPVSEYIRIQKMLDYLYLEEAEERALLEEEKAKNLKFRDYSDFREELVKEGLISV